LLIRGYPQGSKRIRLAHHAAALYSFVVPDVAKRTHAVSHFGLTSFRQQIAVLETKSFSHLFESRFLVWTSELLIKVLTRH
jgi:hypothetical protein